MNQPKVPRNDGTNYADYLLTGNTVNAIAVDGGNRKWIGTLGAGIYLVNADGSEILAHYTAADSPLLSDNRGNGTFSAIFVVTGVTECCAVVARCVECSIIIECSHATC